MRSVAGASAHSLARRDARAMAHANGTTSIPLAAHQTKPPKASVIAPAPIAAVRPASRRVSAAASHARPPSAANESAQAGQRMASPRAPSAQNGASTAGQSMLVAPLVTGAPAWKRSGWPVGDGARVLEMDVRVVERRRRRGPTLARTAAMVRCARNATATASGP